MQEISKNINADINDDEMESYKWKGTSKLLRGHPRWAPTNDINDINCIYFILPPNKRSLMKKQYNWLTSRMDLDAFTDDKNIKNNKLYGGSFMDCIRLKYLMNSDNVTNILIERFGPNEPINTLLYESKHIFKFRDKPPKFFDDKNDGITIERYKQIKYTGNVGLPKMEFEHINNKRKKWGSFYKRCYLRGKIKSYFMSKFDIQ